MIPSHLGYVTLAILVGAESAGVPLPGEAALITGAILAHQGHLQIPLVIGVAALAAIAGDNLGYVLGRRGVRPLLQRGGPFAAARIRTLARGERFFARHGARAVFFGRWVVGARIVVAWMAGANRLPWKRFLMWNALGAISWATSVGVAGYALGAAGAKLFALFGAVGALAFVLALLGVKLARMRARESERRNVSDHAAGPRDAGAER